MEKGDTVQTMKLQKCYAQQRRSCDEHLLHSGGFSKHVYMYQRKALAQKNSFLDRYEYMMLDGLHVAMAKLLVPLEKNIWGRSRIYIFIGNN